MTDERDLRIDRSDPDCVVTPDGDRETVAASHEGKAHRTGISIAESTVGALPAWGPRRVKELRRILLDRASPFPCTFAVSAARKDALRFGFVDDVHNRSTWSVLHDILRDYLSGYRSIARDTSLIVFFGGHVDGLGEGEYSARFWEILQHLHDTDPVRWPDELPVDPDEPMWEFSYAGEPIFVVCNTPAHVNRRSRHSAEFMITFQPRWVFEGIESDTPRGVAVRRTIRKRLRDFDGVGPSAVLGNYGDATNREWLQYFLYDVEQTDRDVGALRCPFRVREHSTRGHGQPPNGRGVPRWQVVVDPAGAHSVWPVHRPVPRGWSSSGVRGDRKHCLTTISDVWKDMRPASVRLATEPSGIETGGYP